MLDKKNLNSQIRTFYYFSKILLFHQKYHFEGLKTTTLLYPSFEQKEPENNKKVLKKPNPPKTTKSSSKLLGVASLSTCHQKPAVGLGWAHEYRNRNTGQGC